MLPGAETILSGGGCNKLGMILGQPPSFDICFSLEK